MPLVVAAPVFARAGHAGTSIPFAAAYSATFAAWAAFNAASRITLDAHPALVRRLLVGSGAQIVRFLPDDVADVVSHEIPFAALRRPAIALPSVG